MQKLVDKQSYTFDYKSRYTGIPYYYDTQAHREVAGICKQISFDTPYVLHKIEISDSLDSLSLEYYGNPIYWWAIAAFNKINDPFIDLSLHYKSLKIPSISSIVFKE